MSELFGGTVYVAGVNVGYLSNDHPVEEWLLSKMLAKRAVADYSTSHLAAVNVTVQFANGYNFVSMWTDLRAREGTNFIFRVDSPTAAEKIAIDLQILWQANRDEYIRHAKTLQQKYNDAEARAGDLWLAAITISADKYR